MRGVSEMLYIKLLFSIANVMLNFVLQIKLTGLMFIFGARCGVSLIRMYVHDKALIFINSYR